MIISLRGVAAYNDELEYCSLLVTMLRNVFRVQDAFNCGNVSASLNEK